MNGFASPTSPPLSPTSLSVNAAHLQRELKLLKDDIAKLTANTEAAADRIALVLKQARLRSQAASAPTEPRSHESDLSITIRDQTFDAFYEHRGSTSLDLSLSGERRHQTSKPEVQSPSFDGESVRSAAEGVFAAHKSPTLPFLSPSKTAHDSLYEQSRTFLSVITFMKEERSRARQFEILEITPTTTLEVCWLVARQVAAYLRFVNLDRIRDCIHKEAQRITPNCLTWWQGPSVFVEKALARYSLNRTMATDPIYDGAVALVLIHFGIFNVEVSMAGAHSVKHGDVSSDRERRAILPKFASRFKVGSRHNTSHTKTHNSTSYTQAISVDTLGAISELCLHGVLDRAVLHDVLVLFALGDVDKGFTIVNSDMELLRAFLNESLLPRGPRFRARFGDLDPVQQTRTMLKTMDKLQHAICAVTPSVESLAANPLGRNRPEEPGWIPLDRLPSSSVKKWPKTPRTKAKGWFRQKGTNGQAQDGLDTQTRFNMIVILNGSDAARD